VCNNCTSTWPLYRSKIRVSAVTSGHWAGNNGLPDTWESPYTLLVKTELKVLTMMTIKIAIFWDGTLVHCVVQFSLPLFWRNVLPPIFRVAPPKPEWTSTRLHDVISQKIVFYIAVKYSRTAVTKLFSLPYPLIRLSIYENPLSSLQPPISQNGFFSFS
jgi:hypothetical protein